MYFSLTAVRFLNSRISSIFDTVYISVYKMRISAFKKNFLGFFFQIVCIIVGCGNPLHFAKTTLGK